MKKYDLMVVGGGILGAFHTYHALERGKKVLLLEKDRVLAGATVRNFGQVVPSGMANEWFGYAARGLEIYGAIQKRFDISVRRNGSVYLASDEDEQRLIHELKAHYNGKGYECVLLTKKEALKKFPAVKASYVREALFFPQEISVEPHLLGDRLLEYMRGKFKKLTMAQPATVLSCEETRAGVKVTTADRDDYEGEKAIVCNGAELKGLYPEVYKGCGLRVCKLQMMQTVPMQSVRMAGNILTGLTIRRYDSFVKHCASYAKVKTPERYVELKERGIHILFKQAKDGSFIVGDSHEYASVEEADRLGFKVDERVNELMLREAGRIVNFDVRKIQQRWAGFYSQPTEGSVFEVDVSKNIHVRTGMGGKGMTCSAGYAEKSVEKIFGEG